MHRPSPCRADEPTSACDPVSTQNVERALMGCGVSLVWITHDSEQPMRVGSSTSSSMLELPTGRIVPLQPPAMLHKLQQ
jgi:ABC-type phosphate transport system ATPase subunit